MMILGDNCEFCIYPVGLPGFDDRIFRTPPESRMDLTILISRVDVFHRKENGEFTEFRFPVCYDGLVFLSFFRFFYHLDFLHRSSTYDGETAFCLFKHCTGPGDIFENIEFIISFSRLEKLFLSTPQAPFRSLHRYRRAVHRNRVEASKGPRPKNKKKDQEKYFTDKVFQCV